MVGVASVISDVWGSEMRLGLVEKVLAGFDVVWSNPGVAASETTFRLAEVVSKVAEGTGHSASSE